jgi:hypothetical protein
MKAANVKEHNYFNLFNRQIDKINYIIFLLSKFFMYLDIHFTHRREKSLNRLAFDLLKNEFIIDLKDNLCEALSYYFKEIEIQESDENYQKHN